ncbi:MAG: hypothetical protein AAFY72_13915 [Cyanobacteria bacterium J06649_4]
MQQGASKVLEALQQSAPSDVDVVASGCLGQCGNGPMLLVLPTNEKPPANETTVNKTAVSGALKETVEASPNKRRQQQVHQEGKTRQRERQKFWYSNVQLKDVNAIAQRHLKGNRPVIAKLYPAVHGTQNPIGIWVVGFFLFLALCVLFAVVLGGQSHYPY